MFYSRRPHPARERLSAPQIGAEALKPPIGRTAHNTPGRRADGLGIITINGAGSHNTSPGDVIICAYAVFEDKELVTFNLRLE